ncbi:MAG: glutamate--cysteine ligase, partial [Burkholderiales bacterium]
SELQHTWEHCLAVAHEVQSTLLMIGILPTIRQCDLNLDHISPRNRYFALNEQILRARGGRPLRVDIAGREHLRLEHHDVMLEAATTSFQLHLQAPADRIGRYFNASALVSAPLVAASANSPFLFGKDLWDETRIPLFEQAVDTGDEPPFDRKRVTFGRRYVEDPLEPFEENLACYPVLLPLECDDPTSLPHLRLHNGTIWRWNRMLIGFDEARRPHLRVEHRVLPAGPSVIDMIANAAVYLGAVHFLACLHRPPERDLPFETARANFYAAARDGLGARLEWLAGAHTDAGSLMLDEVLPMASEGLRQLEIDAADRDRYLEVVAARVRSGQTGAAWQRARAERNGRDLFGLVADYLEHQRSGMPVHEWEV